MMVAAAGVIVASAGTDVIVWVVVAALFLFVILVLKRSVRIIQQGCLGAVKRLGEFRRIMHPGIAFLVPFIESLVRIDVREEPRRGDHQTVITKDNVNIMVNATIFSQVIDVRQALFEVSDYHLAIDQVAEASLRSVVGGMTLDEVLTERERINSELQQHMAPLTEKWGVHLNRIEVIDIIPPQKILEAMALQKEADQRKRAVIHQSEGEQQAAINTAKGQRQAAIEIAEGQKQASILQAEGARQSQVLIAQGQKEAAILQAEGQREAAINQGQGRAAAIGSVYTAIHEGKPTPELLAVLQLDALEGIATSPNAKLVVPVETAGLLGAAQALRSVLGGVPASDGAPAEVVSPALGSPAGTPPPPPPSGPES